VNGMSAISGVTTGATTLELGCALATRDSATAPAPIPRMLLKKLRRGFTVVSFRFT
jgi:hypothetical protein